MSRADERRAEEADLDRDAALHQRPSEPPTVPPNPDRHAWSSACAGWRIGVHEKSREEEGGWRCKWCYQLLTPPTEADRAIVRARSVATPNRQRVRRGRW
jgi:hypothetical protein